MEDIGGGVHMVEVVRGGKLWLGCMAPTANATVLGVAGMGEFPLIASFEPAEELR